MGILTRIAKAALLVLPVAYADVSVSVGVSTNATCDGPQSTANTGTAASISVSCSAAGGITEAGTASASSLSLAGSINETWGKYHYD